MRFWKSFGLCVPCFDDDYDYDDYCMTVMTAYEASFVCLSWLEICNDYIQVFLFVYVFSPVTMLIVICLW